MLTGHPAVIQKMKVYNLVSLLFFFELCSHIEFFFNFTSI